MQNDFDCALEVAATPLRRTQTEILQLNVGKLCNLTCLHCHVNAGPGKKEIVGSETVDKILRWMERTKISTLDLTGGTPEMAPDFRRLITTVRGFAHPRKIIDRLNATIINEPGYEWVVEFLAEHEVEVVASMPCYRPDNVNAQRGEGVFDSSISGFQKLNEVGYGRNSKLRLNFVYNPNGAFLPGSQEELREDYRREMKLHFGIDFHDLYCITNMPIARFAAYLKRNNQLHSYMQLLKDSFKPCHGEWPDVSEYDQCKLDRGGLRL